MSAARIAAALGAALLAAAPGARAADDAELAAGRKLFNTVTPACALCHTLKDAGSTGQIGPVLDELRPDAERVATAMRDGIGSMPSFKDTLTEAQIQALARYVARASGGATR